MTTFQQLAGSRLYQAPTGTNDRGWLGYLLPEGVTAGPSIVLSDALGDPTLGGSFLFSAIVPDLSGASLTTFVTALDKVLATAISRAIVWLADLSDIEASTAPLLCIDSTGTRAVASMTAPLAPNLLSLLVQSGAIASAGDDVTFSNNNPPIASFSGGRSPGASATTATLSFAGPQRGCIRFSTFIACPTLVSTLACGFQFVIPSPDAVHRVAEWIPLIASCPGPAAIGFAVSIDPSDPLNVALPDSTAFVFTGQNQDGSSTTLVSCYSTTAGATVLLTPVPAPSADTGRLVLNLGTPTGSPGQQLQFAPAGDFILGVAGAEPDLAYELLCGLGGTEFIGFQPAIAGGYAGDRIRFAARQPAYAAHYPPPASTPVGDPVDPGAPLLDPSSPYKTSWATVIRTGTGGIPYVAQPKGASLYGRDDLINDSSNTLFGSENPCAILPENVAFPMVPYSGVSIAPPPSFSTEVIEDLESQVIGPTRRGLIGNARSAQSPEVALGLVPAAPPMNTATPAGLLVTVETDGTWGRVLLGQNVSPSLRQLCFCSPDRELQQALGTSQLFLVIANGAHLGPRAGNGDGTCSGAAFFNTMNVETWELAADVGDNNYNDYTNVVIVKGRKGALYDPTNEQTKRDSLVSNPSKWTQKEVFAAPSNLPPGEGPGGPPDVAQLPVLSLWLQQYFQSASEQADTAYFRMFNEIARNPDWTGMLVLRMHIAGLPPELAPLAAGITDPSRFYAHHFAIELSQIQNDPDAPVIEMAQSSSMFGLIYYVDPEFTPPAAGKAAQPVLPPSGVDYDFRTLTLQVLFENTSVKSFRSYAQITLNRLFGTPVDHMGAGGNTYNTIVLVGSFQNNGGQPLYSLASTGDTTFYLDSNVINKIEVTTAQMSRRSPGSDPVVAWFGLSGFIDFKIVTAANAVPFDILSFGSLQGEDALRAGLSYSNLGLQMAFPADDPTKRTLAFMPGEIRFDVARSTPRPDSLFVNFALELQDLASGTAQSGPGDAGYLNVITDAALSGVDGSDWFGIRYQLNMGTPGSLAGDVGLTSSLLTAWSPASTGSQYRALVGLELPGTGGGAKLISLQSVLKLSIGQIRLTYVAGKESFLLMLTEIALKFLGLLKIPPNGSTLFYLFGNPKSDGKASGLGWYAMYRQKAPPPRGQLAVTASPAAIEGGGPA
jgi:hypothetical protein